MAPEMNTGVPVGAGEWRMPGLERPQPAARLQSDQENPSLIDTRALQPEPLQPDEEIARPVDSDIPDEDDEEPADVMPRSDPPMSPMLPGGSPVPFTQMPRLSSPRRLERPFSPTGDPNSLEYKHEREREEALNFLIEKLRLPEIREGTIEAVYHGFAEMLKASSEPKQRAYEIACFIPGGIIFEEEDKDLPPQYQSKEWQAWMENPRSNPKPKTKPEQFISAQNPFSGNITIYPRFADIPRDQFAHTLSHEIGDLMQRTDTTGEPGHCDADTLRPEAKDGKELFLNVAEYERLFGVNQRDPSWNIAYVRDQFVNNNELAINEQLADDIGDFMRASNWQDFFTNRIARLENAEELRAQFDSRDPRIADMATHFQQVYGWLKPQFDANKGKLKLRNTRPPVPADMPQWSDAKLAHPSGAFGGGMGGQAAKGTVSSFIDFIFGQTSGKG